MSKMKLLMAKFPEVKMFNTLKTILEMHHPIRVLKRQQMNALPGLVQSLSNLLTTSTLLSLTHTLNSLLSSMTMIISLRLTLEPRT